jgi:diguanylate cyclase (GGDEF)-like protein
MSLFKQMVIMFSLFLGIILALVMVLNFKTANEFVQNQLYNDAKNTAHSLGLSLSKVADPSDISTMETMINAIYDSGYYEEISLSDIDGKVLYARKSDLSITDVPVWFTTLVTIQPASVNSDIMIGWSRFGTLKVSGHTGNAYRQLYNTLQKIIQTFLLVGLCVFIALYFLLKLSLKSLVRIRNQAKAIIDNQFIFEEKIPFTTEFRSVTVAMNAMVGKVKDIFDRENETLQRYQELLYKDAQTKLYNRRYAISKLPDYLQADSLLSSGSFVLFSIDEPENLKKACGYQTYNNLVVKLSSCISDRFSSNSNGLLARLNEGDFLVMSPQEAHADTTRVAQEILTQLKEEMSDETKEVEMNINAGVGDYSSSDTLKSLFSRADNCLIQAKSLGGYSVSTISSGDTSMILGREEWKKELLLSIEESRLLLAFQSVVLHGDTDIVLHEEVFLRFLDREGTIHSAGYFIPIATTLGLMDMLDRAMISQVLSYIKEEKIATPMALNISLDFIGKPINIEWLKGELKLFSGTTTPLWFEISNAVVVSHMDSVKQFVEVIRNFGHHFGIDHFVLPDDGAHYLRTIRPDYVKANASYLSDMMIDKNSGSVRESLNNLVKSLGITIIAMMVESSEEYEELQTLGIKRFQGTFIAPVAMLK